MFKCVFCNKYYKSQKCLHKHYVKCSVEHNINVLDCNKELFDMMRHMMNANKSLTARVEKLERLCYKENKKIDVLKWLNENKKDHMYMERFMESIIIMEEELSYIYDDGIEDGLIKIIEINMEKQEKKPFISFERKSYVLYSNGEKGWMEVKEDNFKSCILGLQKKALKQFRKLNPVDKLKTDREHIIYNKRLISICDVKFSNKIKNIKNELYRKNKININKLVKYDFIF
jgi:hypothetical protein